MEKIIIGGIEINKVSFKELFFNKLMILAYILLAIGAYAIYKVIEIRYFFPGAINAHTAGMHPGSHQLIASMKEALYGDGGEVKREAPWNLYIVNYIYMIYTGSGIIFLVALFELFNVKIIKKTAAGFLTFGLCIMFAGFFSIVVDLNDLHMLWMFITPNFGAGIWLMLPLYSTYIPFVMFEIYLLITHKREFAKKISFVILLLSVLLDIIEYYIQARLFSMSTPRHLWTGVPVLTLYYIVSAYVAAIGVMAVYSYFTYKDSLNKEYHVLMNTIRNTTLVCIALLVAYEIVIYFSIDKRWGDLLYNGPFKDAFFGGYVLLAIAIPFVLSLVKNNNNLPVITGLFIIIGTYIGRYLFVFGGNAYPLSNRFGTGFEKYGIYEKVVHFIYYSPEMPEILVVIGSLGVTLGVYVFVNKLLSVSKVREH